jgi:hypothetical protein
MKRKARRIVVDGQVFAWYTEPFSAALRIYAEKAPGFLEVIFRDGGFGFAYLNEDTYNLNRPAVVTALIQSALQRGWQPDQGKQVRWSNGNELLAGLSLLVQ